MPNTPDRAALAERLREMLAGVRRTQRAVAQMWFSTESLRDESLARSERQAEALAAAIAALAAPAPIKATPTITPPANYKITVGNLAAPAVPPSVAEAREAVEKAVDEYAPHPRRIDETWPIHDALDRYAAAVRAATVAEAVRAVEAVDVWPEGASNRSHPATVKTDAPDALRALEVQP